jgi:hypothetical protein
LPITFAQQQPFSEQLSTQYGQQAAQGRGGGGQAQNNAIAADVYMQAARLQAASAEAGEDRELRKTADQNDRIGLMENAGRNRAFQLQENEQQNAQRQAQAAQHAELQMQVNTAELSQTEKVRMQRMRNALGTIDEQVASGFLNPEEGNTMKLQVQTGLNNYQQREAAFQAKAAELKYAQVAQQQAHATSLQGLDLQHWNAMYEQTTRQQPDGSRVQFIPGKGYSVVPGTEPKAAPKPETDVPFDWKKEWDQSMAEAKAAKPTLGEDSEELLKYAQQVVTRREAEFKARQGTRQQAAQQGPPAANAQQAQPPVGARQLPQEPPIQRAVPVAARRPFDIDDPKAIPPEQKPFREDYVRQLHDINKLPSFIPEDRKNELKMVATDMIKLVADAGSPEAMTDAELRAFLAARKKFEAGMTAAQNAKSPEQSAEARIRQQLANPVVPADAEGQIRNQIRPLLPR